MTNTQIVEETISFVKETLKHAEGGHDWFHIQRVFNNAILIAKDEDGADPLTISLGALLHDIADPKFNDGDETVGPKTAEAFLRSIAVDDSTVKHVVNIIKYCSFKSDFEFKPFHSKELDVVQDADRLDAIGAIGIARAFNYGGYKNRGLYDPDIQPDLNMTKEEYKNSNAPTVNHFYEKLLLLKDRMKTEAGKRIAEQRHEFMKTYLTQFYDEWNGRK